jgi:hypothetical protein
LANDEEKLPDVSFTIVPERFPNPQVILKTFVINGAGGSLAPQLVVEVTVCNGIMPQFAVTDLERYFASGTGTRAWIGIKIWKSSKQWWCGWASRSRGANNQFLDAPVMSDESMPIASTNNVSILRPTNIVFHIDVATLLDPFAPPFPPNTYPTTFDINLERIRQIAIRYI